MAPKPTAVRQRRAVGIVRVSQVAGREAERFISPADQRRQIERVCSLQGITLTTVHEELDVSGYSRVLAKRPGLSKAIAAIEAGQADVIVVAYFDRLVRKARVQEEVLERVEKAGGSVLAVDAGEVRIDTAAKWLSAGMFGLMNEYFARLTAEKTAGPKEAAIAGGIPTFPNIPLGYRKDPKTRRIFVDQLEAALVREMFQRRLDGASLKELRDWLREQGINRSWRAVQEMLRNRMYLGELHFGSLENLESHEPIISPSVFRRVLAKRAPRGRREKSVRLLARQEVLFCAACGGRMVVGGQNKNGKRYVDYRCNPLGTCTQRVSISAPLLEARVVAWVKQRLEDAQKEGSAVTGPTFGEIEAALEKAEAKYARAQRNALLLDLGANPDTRSFLKELENARNEARDRYEALRAKLGVAATASAEDWERMPLLAQRSLIRALIQRIIISRSGSQRIDIQPFTA